jgi:CDP-diacylglycerol---glycerol-3-phosphate 3-phosphatidyltransferase
VFLYLALESGDGRSAAAAILYALIAGGDYLDGLVARATGQYSRMGAILDPIVDRVTILSGVIVCWHFELLPRWALAALIARELVTVLAAEIGLRRGMDVEVNWLGRIGVWVAMTAIFLALAVDTWLSTAMLFVGLAALILATVLYVRTGLGPKPSTR